MSIHLRVWLVAMACAALLLTALGGVVALLASWLTPSLGPTAAGWPVFALGVVAVLVVFAPIAWLLAGLAYAPVRDVAKTAHSIVRTGELDRRCFYPGPHDDVGRLVVVVNELLVRYDAALGALQRLRAAPPSCDCPRQVPALDPADLALELGVPPAFLPQAASSADAGDGRSSGTVGRPPSTGSGHALPPGTPKPASNGQRGSPASLDGA